MEPPLPVHLHGSRTACPAAVPQLTVVEVAQPSIRTLKGRAHSTAALQVA